jgi:undecaprenyl diphosphate synthase
MAALDSRYRPATVKLHFPRLPKHIGFIPDGNRRWARERGLPEAEGYKAGVCKGLELVQTCCQLGIEEITIYGFTQDNTKRPREQRVAFASSCVAFAEAALEFDVALLVVGDTSSPMFPTELKSLAKARQGHGLKVNMLVNYGWEWDLRGAANSSSGRALERMASHEIPRMDMIVRWGGYTRLSGFLPVQSVYADIFVVDDYWPDYQESQFLTALTWFQTQEPTLGG